MGSDEGWVCSDLGWEIWSGTVDIMAVDWKAPSRSAVRSLLDTGEGPPMLREGSKVIRGLDWDEPGSGSVTKNEDGKDIFEKEKSNREKEKSNEVIKNNSSLSPEEPDVKVNVTVDETSEEAPT